MLRIFCLLLLIALASACCPKKTPQQEVTKAIAVMKGAVSGTVTFAAVPGGVRVKGTINGMTDGKHGFHVHQLGDLTSCTTALGHYKPRNKKHGAFNKVERHVGDLQQLTSKSGVATIDYIDSVIPLIGMHSIVGRMLVVHAGADDLGLAGNTGSETTGNAGSRLNCAVIGIMAP